MENTRDFVPRSEKFGKKIPTSRMERRTERKFTTILFENFFQEEAINKLFNMFDRKRKNKTTVQTEPKKKGRRRRI
jgi:hypothetical protein